LKLKEEAEAAEAERLWIEAQKLEQEEAAEVEKFK
jgi:hypothetical protein